MTISTSTPTRVVVLLTSISLVLVLLLAGAVAAFASDTAPTVTASVEHTVVVGDTLWDIAAVYTDPGDDVRETIHEIRAANEMPDSVVRVGQVLVIPLEF